MIKGLYDTLGKDSNFLKNTILPSYSFKLSPIVVLALNKYKNGEMNLDDLKNLEFRLFPAKNNKDSLSTIIALELGNKTFVSDDNAFDYIGPCPKNCSDDDFYKRKEWEDIYNNSLKRKLEY